MGLAGFSGFLFLSVLSNSSNSSCCLNCDLSDYSDWRRCNVGISCPPCCLLFQQGYTGYLIHYAVSYPAYPVYPCQFSTEIRYQTGNQRRKGLKRFSLPIVVGSPCPVKTSTLSPSINSLFLMLEMSVSKFPPGKSVRPIEL